MRANLVCVKARGQNRLPRKIMANVFLLFIFTFLLLKAAAEFNDDNEASLFLSGVASLIVGLLLYAFLIDREQLFNPYARTLFYRYTFFGRWIVRQTEQVSIDEFNYVYIRELEQGGGSLYLFSTRRNEQYLFSVSDEKADDEAERIALLLGIKNKGRLTQDGFTR